MSERNSIWIQNGKKYCYIIERRNDLDTDKQTLVTTCVCKFCFQQHNNIRALLTRRLPRQSIRLFTRYAKAMCLHLKLRARYSHQPMCKYRFIYTYMLLVVCMHSELCFNSDSSDLVVVSEFLLCLSSADIQGPIMPLAHLSPSIFMWPTHGRFV